MDSARKKRIYTQDVLTVATLEPCRYYREVFFAPYAEIISLNYRTISLELYTGIFLLLSLYFVLLLLDESVSSVAYVFGYAQFHTAGDHFEYFPET